MNQEEVKKNREREFIFLKDRWFMIVSVKDAIHYDIWAEGKRIATYVSESDVINAILSFLSDRRGYCDTCKDSKFIYRNGIVEECDCNYNLSKNL